MKHGFIVCIYIYTGVSKNRGFPPKWMVKIMENRIRMDDLGGKPNYFWKHPYIRCMFSHTHNTNTHRFRLPGFWPLTAGSAECVAFSFLKWKPHHPTTLHVLHLFFFSGGFWYDNLMNSCRQFLEKKTSEKNLREAEYVTQKPNQYHPCMVYFPAFSCFFMLKVGKYTVHGSGQME